MIKIFITCIVKWASQLRWADFETIIASVTKAATLYPKPATATPQQKTAINLNRALLVAGTIAARWPKLSPGTINLLRELALAWVNRK